MADETAGRILSFVRKAFPARQEGGAPLDPSSPLFSSGLIDSMGVVELLAFLEQEFHLSLDLTLQELRRLDSAAALAEQVESLRQARARR